MSYVPTTEEVREYIEAGGEPRPWEPQLPELGAKRVAAFDRWLAQVRAEAQRDALVNAAALIGGQEGPRGGVRMADEVEWAQWLCALADKEPGNGHHL